MGPVKCRAFTQRALGVEDAAGGGLGVAIDVHRHGHLDKISLLVNEAHLGMESFVGAVSAREFLRATE